MSCEVVGLLQVVKEGHRLYSQPLDTKYNLLQPHNHTRAREAFTTLK